MTGQTRAELRRPHAGRRMGGVCAGLATHLNQPVRHVRWVFALAGFAAGAGALMYAWLWLVVPAESAPPRTASSGGGGAGGTADSQPTQGAQDTGGAARGVRLAPRLQHVRERVSDREFLLAGILLGIAALLLLVRGQLADRMTWMIAIVLIGLGAALAWSQVGGRHRDAGPRSVLLARVGAGCGLAVVGVVIGVGQGRSMRLITWAGGVGLLIVAALAVVLAPIGLRLWQGLGRERAARAREAERADIAAHLHDSVLQTLALIRSRVSDPAAVTQLARAQERQLREWLYTDRPDTDAALARQVEAVAAEVEERYGRQIDAITVGDAARGVGAGAPALVAATREALTNAVRHGAAPVSLFLEVTETGAEVYVRDRGAGFDLDQVPADRHGVRESIIERMRRHGGDADIRTRPGHGTEVRLTLPYRDGGDRQEASPTRATEKESNE